MARPQWYKAKDYKQPMERSRLKDGSFVEVVAVGEELLLTREWPNKTTDRIRISCDENGTYGYKVADKDQFGIAKAFIGDPDWHAPYAFSNTVPGTSPSSIETYDFRTGRDYEGGRKELEAEYRKLGLQLTQSTDQYNFHERARPKPPEEGEINHGRFVGAKPNAPEGAQRSVYREDLNKVKDWDYG